MDIPSNYYNILISEFEEIEKLITDSKTVSDKLFFFSATFGTVNRIMNFYYNPTLVFIHQVLQATHQSLSQRLAAINNPNSISDSFPNELMDALCRYLSELCAAFESRDNNQILEILQKFSNLWYASTGNGFYLYIRGKLTLS